MPISTAGINSILEAYQQGIMTSQYKRSEATRQKERAENIKLEEQHRKEDIARLEQHYNLEQAKQDALHQAAANLQQYQLQNEMQSIYRKTGETPSGYSSIKAESVPLAEGVAGTKQTFGPDTSSLNPILQKPVFSAMDPTSAAIQEAERARITEAPKQEFALKEIYTKKLLDDLEKSQERSDKLKMHRDTMQNNLDVAKLRASNKTDLSPLARNVINNPDLLNDPKLMDPSQKAAVLNEIAKMGVNLATPMQNQLYDSATDILDQIKQVKESPEFRTGMVAKVKGAIPGTSEYNFGHAVTQLKTLLAIPELKNLRGLGSMSDKEFAAMQAAATTLDIGQKDADFKNELKKLEDSFTKVKGHLEKFKNNSTGGTSNRIKVDAQGNEIPVNTSPQQITPEQLTPQEDNRDQSFNNSQSTVAQRNNNPLNIKVGSATQKLIDLKLAEIGEKAKDGGNFLKFKNANGGFEAAMGLLSSDVYANQTIDAAMKKWSNSGYDASIVKDIPATKKIKDLTFPEKAKLIEAMAKQEGFYNTSN